MINSAFAKIVESKADDLEIHFIYAGEYYNIENDNFISFFSKGMKIYKIKSVMVTSINMWRLQLIKKERMENYCKGKEWQKDSVNDDLESLFQDLQLGKEPSDHNDSYFLPKLTNEELKLVDKNDQIYLKTLKSTENPLFGVDLREQETEMMMSESKSKFVEGFADRFTIRIHNS